MKKTIAQAYANMTAEDMRGYIEGSFDDRLWIRGHHDPQTFVEGILLEYDNDVPVVPKAEDVSHLYWRIKRADEYDHWDTECDYVYVVAKKGRGAFPVTTWGD